VQAQRNTEQDAPLADGREARAERAVIDVRNLFKRREQSGSAFELRAPHVYAEPGEFIALVGESGCGKSTLLDILALVLRPDAADRFVLRPPRADSIVNVMQLWAQDAEEAMAQVRRELLGYVLQSGGLLPFLSVRRNITLPQRLKNGRAGDVTDLAARMGMDALLDKKPRYLSGGQRQRVAILRALAHRPAIILADEPTAAVDGARARAIMRDFRELARSENSAIVMVSHDLKLVEAFADRIYGYVVEAPSEGLTQAVCVEQDDSA
jgi:putative ABC transport system ATP-binding protein